MALPWDEYARSIPDDIVDLESSDGRDPSINWPYYNHLMGLAGPDSQNIEPDNSIISSSLSANSPLNRHESSPNFDGNQYRFPLSNSPESPQWLSDYQPTAPRSPVNTGFNKSDFTTFQPDGPNFQNLDDQAYPPRVGSGYTTSNIQDVSGPPNPVDYAQPWWRGDLDRSPWTPDAPLELTPVGNPANRRLRKEWERENGPWPRDPKTGRNYDVAHKKALADGGTNTVDNIHPMHPDAHVAEHMANGDYSRWALRPGIARAFGGTVARSLDFLSIVPLITGVLSGRIRTDTMEHYLNDIAGVPSSDDPIEPLEA